MHDLLLGIQSHFSTQLTEGLLGLTGILQSFALPSMYCNKLCLLMHLLSLSNRNFL
jgi:hypothetical protein